MKSSKNRLKAEEAKEKKAAFGPDIDLNAFLDDTPEHGYLPDVSELPGDKKESMLSVGVDADEKDRSGTFVQMDHSVVHSSSKQEGIEILGADEALKKYGWLSDYWWKAVDVGADKYTAQAELKHKKGYFIRADVGVKSKFPVQACLYLDKENLAQNVHNIIIAEEGAELNIITGCTTAPRIGSGIHIGISEFYVKKNAKVTFTMIHNWGEEIVVRPRSVIIVEEGGTFISNYVCMKKTKSLQMYPTVHLNGKNSLARLNSIIVAPRDSEMDVGSRVMLNEEGARAEIVSRAITTGGKIIARGHLAGNAKNIKAHLECRGLILSDEGAIHAIPELEGHVKNIDMSHEAAVGKIAQDEIEYLMARGLAEDEATSIIVRGFLNVGIEGLPPQLKYEIDRVISSSDVKGM
ncbi:MAG: hypothetical protein A7316_01010 [Candidatus Altiarchaeales archaeon WOR_SM1_86-2]|nr:MAG: hypothetical protein A7316_01010 [Candidatus Altiarchaeales archaeon WOR_SM1_86-2]